MIETCLEVGAHLRIIELGFRSNLGGKPEKILILWKIVSPQLLCHCAITWLHCDYNKTQLPAKFSRKYTVSLKNIKF